MTNNTGGLGGIYTLLDQYLHDDLIGLDGKPVIPSYNDFLATHVSAYLDVLAEKHPIRALFDDDGRYLGIDASIPKKVSGFYVIGYEHPITNARSFYSGSSIDCIRARFTMAARHIFTGKKKGKESDALARQWVAKHGRNFDYAFYSIYPADLPQSRMRPVESLVTKNYRKLYGADVLNKVDKPLLTLEKKEPTPVLVGLDI